MQSNIAWPKNYHPDSVKIKRPPIKNNGQNEYYQKLKEKHDYQLLDVPEDAVDQLIRHIPMLCETKNGFNTYKKNKWKHQYK